MNNPLWRSKEFQEPPTFKEKFILTLNLILAVVKEVFTSKAFVLAIIISLLSAMAFSQPKFDFKNPNPTSIPITQPQKQTIYSSGFSFVNHSINGSIMELDSNWRIIKIQGDTIELINSMAKQFYKQYQLYIALKSYMSAIPTVTKDIYYKKAYQRARSRYLYLLKHQYDN